MNSETKELCDWTKEQFRALHGFGKLEDLTGNEDLDQCLAIAERVFSKTATSAEDAWMAGIVKVMEQNKRALQDEVKA